MSCLGKIDERTAVRVGLPIIGNTIGGTIGNEIEEKQAEADAQDKATTAWINSNTKNYLASLPGGSVTGAPLDMSQYSSTPSGLDTSVSPITPPLTIAAQPVTPLQLSTDLPTFNPNGTGNGAGMSLSGAAPFLPRTGQATQNSVNQIDNGYVINGSSHVNSYPFQPGGNPNQVEVIVPMGSFDPNGVEYTAPIQISGSGISAYDTGSVRVWTGSDGNPRFSVVDNTNGLQSIGFNYYQGSVHDLNSDGAIIAKIPKDDVTFGLHPNTNGETIESPNIIIAGATQIGLNTYSYSVYDSQNFQHIADVTIYNVGQDGVSASISWDGFDARGRITTLNNNLSHMDMSDINSVNADYFTNIQQDTQELEYIPVQIATAYANSAAGESKAGLSPLGQNVFTKTTGAFSDTLDNSIYTQGAVLPLDQSEPIVPMQYVKQNLDMMSQYKVLQSIDVVLYWGLAAQNQTLTPNADGSPQNSIPRIYIKPSTLYAPPIPHAPGT